MGFREDVVNANEKIAMPTIRRVIHDSSLPVNACGFRIM